MDEIEEGFIALPKRRIKKGARTKTITFTLPEFIYDAIEEEAKEKNNSKSQVAAYLIYSGLKAHIGTFLYPKENTIKKNYLKRGRTWIRHQKTELP